MQAFFLSEIKNGENFLSPGESHHCLKVLRMASGTKAIFLDGKGTLAEGEILNSGSRICRVNIHNIYRNHQKRNYRLHVAIAPTKNSGRFEWFLEKSVEIGIDRITPVLCTRSERKRLNMERSEKILLSAMKQSLTTTLPVMQQMLPLNKFIESIDPENTFMAFCDYKEGNHLKNYILPNQEYTVIIGPEGGFSPEEALFAKEKGVQLVSLGASRLRTETAAIVACHTIQLLHE
jgi:16S rRNA (uracil1498-N3)-methyltransferase